MQPVQATFAGEEIAIICVHWKAFPPASGLSLETPEYQKMVGLVTENEYHRHKTWERVCGLLHMEPGKCLTCEHCRKIGQKNHSVVLITMDGKVATPTVDAPTIEVLPRGRGNLVTAIRPPGTPGSSQNAAWVDAENDDTNK